MQEHLARLDRRAAQHGLLDRHRLLEDLLEHEVLVSGLLRHDRIPRDARALLRDGASGVVGELDAARRDHRHLLVAHEDDVAGVREDRRDVRRDEELVLAKPDDDRRAVADGDDLVRIVRGDQHQREEPAHVEQRAADGVLEPVPLRFALDEVRDDLRVGLGDERVPFELQLLLQIEIVLDDAVVDDDDAPGAVAMRMGVLLGGPPVRRPARVADAVLAVERTRHDRFLETRELAGAAAQLDRAVAHDRDAGRVVAAILETPQPVDQDRKDLLVADVADDAAHVILSTSDVRRPTSDVDAETSTPRTHRLVLLLLDPAVDVSLLARADGERARRHVLADRSCRCRRRRPCAR